MVLDVLLVVAVVVVVATIVVVDGSLTTGVAGPVRFTVIAGSDLR